MTDMLPSSHEMRQYLRLKPEPGFPISVDINGDGFIDVVHALDIGEGGLRIKVSHQFNGCHIDNVASFIVHLPQPVNKDIRLKGRIRHVHNDSFGVQFVALGDGPRAYLRRYIAVCLRHRSFWEYVRYTFGWIR
jgi:hypothetical protein